MYRITPSETARNAINALSPVRRAEFEEIADNLSAFFVALERAGLVHRLRWWGRDGYLYFDKAFPYGLFLEKFDREQEIYIHVLLPGPPRLNRR